MPDFTTGAMQEFGGSAGPTPSGRGPQPGLVLLYTEQFGDLPSAFPFTTGRMVIGRDPSADICVPVNAVSRSHAEFIWRDGVWVLRDLGSRNGTILDGRLVNEATLETTQEIRVGDAIFKFVDKHSELFFPYRIDGSMLANHQRRASTPSQLVGGYQMDRIAAEIERIAPTELSVIVLGESGTGKEVVARELHRLSGRRGQFCAVNCAAIPATLIESELFGYKRGAFSGADRDKPGLVRMAHGGTLLLDEIGDMPLSAQTKLLRLLQSKEVFPVGATAAEHVDVRVVCATHRDLTRLQSEGRFREDLYARLNEYQLFLPPLRERKEDIYVLTRTFLARYGRPELKPSFLFMTAMVHYDWQYNVRELEACIKRGIALAEAPLLEEKLLPEPIREAMNDYGQPHDGKPSDRRAPMSVDTPITAPAAVALSSTRGGIPSDAELRALLEAHKGNVAAVGRQLGKARMQIHRWMRRYGIEVDDYRDS
jgi:transcriptional regulator with GAF, ATPase, and Fis domain